MVTVCHFSSLPRTATDNLSVAGKKLPASQQKKTKAKKEDLDEDDLAKKKLDMDSEYFRRLVNVRILTLSNREEGTRKGG